MAEPSVLGKVIVFFQELGIYDVVLPFLLVFTIVFAIFEKTKILGTEKIGETVYTRKNLNAMAAFVVGFLVVASSKIVEAITTVSSQMVVLVMLVVFFLMLIGSFYKEGEIGEKGFEKDKWWKHGFMIGILIAILAIFLNAIKTEDGKTWLEVVFGGVTAAGSGSSTAIASLIFMVLLVAFIAWLMKPSKEVAAGGTATKEPSEKPG